MYPRNEACNSHCKTMFIFRIWCKNISSDVSMWKLLSVKWIFCLASFMTKELYLISQRTFYLLAHFNSSHWWPHFLPQFSIIFSPKQVLVIFSHKWLIGLGDKQANFLREQTSRNCGLLCQGLCVSDVLTHIQLSFFLLFLSRIWYYPMSIYILHMCSKYLKLVTSLWAHNQLVFRRPMVSYVKNCVSRRFGPIIATTFDCFQPRSGITLFPWYVKHMLWDPSNWLKVPGSNQLVFRRSKTSCQKLCVLKALAHKYKVRGSNQLLFNKT